MFMQNLKYSLKALVRNKSLIFWTFAFPILMSIFFNMAFSNIEKDEQFNIFNIAIIDNKELKEEEFIKETFDTLGDSSNEDQLFNVKYVQEEEEAKQLLNDKEIEGYLVIENETPKIVIRENGINATILQSVVKQINQNKKIVENIIAEKIETEMIQGNDKIDYEQIYKDAINSLQLETKELIKDKSPSNISYIMIEYYTLIAMSCLMGALLGMSTVNNVLPNMSKKGMRISVAPTKKTVMVLSSSIAAFIIQLIEMTLLFAFTMLVLNVDYGSKILEILLLAFVGSLSGISLGIFLGSVLKVSENLKTGIIIAVTNLGCFFAGMMGVTMKYIIDTNAPVVNMVNPANMITDGLYSLYYYNTMNRYWFNIGSLVVFSVILIVISIISLRRQKYDSI